MLAIARALLTNPTLLIMDEPSEGLAPAIIEHLIETFRALEEEGLAILLIEQNLGMATAIAERQLVMVAGSIAAETTATELSQSPELQRRYLGVEPLAEHALVPTVVLVGTLDTKGASTRSCATGCASTASRCCSSTRASTSRRRRAGRLARGGRRARPGADVAELAAAGDRGAAVTAMGAGAERVVRALHAEGRLDGILALGGSGGSSIATRAMRALPVGVPKLMVSTVASGDTRPYVGAVDVTMMYSVVDIAGVNRVSARIMANAAGAIAGHGRTRRCPSCEEKPLVGATMFGVTTPCVTRARERLEELGYEVLVFHATGTGGQSMEALVRDGFLAGVLDMTTTELADELVGGVLSAGPDRLEAAGAAGVPQVVSLGALDMVNFGPRETRAAAVRGPQPLRPQPDRDADADDAGGVRGARAHGSAGSSRRRPGRPRSSSRCAASR